MIRSDAFDYINVVDRAMDASYLRETVLSNNIANVDTPQYKRQDVEFSSVLKNAMNGTGETSVSQAVKKLDTSALDPVEYTDYPQFSYRIDKNNVDIDTENVELASEQLRYQTLSRSATLDFSRFKAVIS